LIYNSFAAYNGFSTYFIVMILILLGKEGIFLPFLRFKGFEKEWLQTVSPVIVEEFAHLAEVAKEKVKIELLHAEQITNSPLSVEILMFEREQKKHDAIARMIHDILRPYGYGNTHIFFIMLSPSLYYKEGLPLATKSIC